METLPARLTVPAAARELGVAEVTVRKAIKSGELAAVKLGKRPYLQPAYLRAYLSTPTNRPIPATTDGDVLAIIEGYSAREAHAVAHGAFRLDQIPEEGEEAEFPGIVAEKARLPLEGARAVVGLPFFELKRAMSVAAVGRSTILEALKTGELAGRQLARPWLISPLWLETWLTTPTTFVGEKTGNAYARFVREKFMREAIELKKAKGTGDV
jgi:excisionase family DNA binding protein